MKKIGFIGGGNMAQAMIGGIIKSKIIEPENIIVSDLNEEILEFVNQKFKVITTVDNLKTSLQSDILFLSVKPNLYEIVIKQIKENIKNDVIIVAIAAGQSIKRVEELFDKELKVIKVMPNTPSLVGEGMAAICPNKLVEEKELNFIIDIFNSFGKSEIVPEYLMDAVTAVSGSSPAYVYMFIEALADGAVLQGLPRDKAYKMAAQTVLGAAKMVLETGEHPAKLKDMVCSPGGTTIEAIAKLEEKGFRTSVIEAMKACTDKSRNMSK
ncbi:pyrroline-5-carboxylate reductase [Oceanotoga teriensis]|uniref:pyrroline-5-carboxylate reductase n=1 Tax=Oceanotoga teriensis TaxID=515440 RepID=UPI0027142D9D|nr:pyrroline-5-carboxylate reductase [Oceanotoga teriensis]MDO7977802.1 pyrroline-5-carboxylate reductase [Oceanotoga teriensis]